MGVENRFDDVLHGIITPTFTAFDDDGELDVEGTSKHLEFVIRGGVHGVFVLGTNGEFPLLNFEEKRRVIETAVDQAAGRVPVLAGVGSAGTAETVALSQYAERVGADGVVVVTPYYYSLSHAGALAHYRAVAESIDLPIFIYHIPPRTGNTLSLETLEALAEIPNVRGIKDSSGDLNWFYQAVQRIEDFTFLIGNDALIYSALSLNATGGVSATSNVFPELVVGIYEAFISGDLEEAKRLQDQVTAIRATLMEWPISGFKAALELRSLSVGGPRAPLTRLGPEEMEKLHSQLDALGVLNRVKS
ncbi:MAG: 4-hydroxy-tetrahydrodipicolinate synthase [Candidatus Bipolaricaulia bacterium]